MEWLQTYKIGKALIDSGQYKPIDAYYAKPQFKPEKRNWVVDLIIDLPKKEIRLDPVIINESELERTIKEDNFFVKGGSSFNSFYLSTPFSNVTSILDFFGIIHKKDKKTGNEKKLGKSFEQIFNLNPINNDPNNNQEISLLFLRDKVNGNNNVRDKLKRTLLNIGCLLGKGKDEKDYKKQLDKYLKIEELKKKPVLNESEQKELKLIENGLISLIGLNQAEVRLNLSKTTDDNILYVRTKLIYQEKEYILSQSSEYEALYLNRFVSELGKLNSPHNGICYFSGESEVYNVGFPRDFINILRISTGEDKSAPFFHGNNFCVSKNAYFALKLGARFISENLTVLLSGVKHYIIPEFTDNINIEKLCLELKSNVDLSLQVGKYDITRRSLYNACDKKINSFVFVGHKANDRSIELTNIIKVPNAQYFDKIFEVFDECVEEMDKISNFSFNFPFNSTYYVFVERYRKDKISNQKKPLNKPQSLEFFKMLFERSSIEKTFLMNAYKQILNVYHFGKPAKEGDAEYGGTLNLKCGKPFIKNKFDSKISKATKKYIVLLNLTRRLGLLRDKTIIKMEQKDYSKLNERTKTLFKNCSYSAQQKSLFFLGKMICRVANAQHKKGAKHKPILNKINYSGMEFKDLIWLSCEVFEKMKQYNKSLNTFNFGQEDMTAFKYYFDQFNGKTWKLTDIENVFYIFSGYALYWETVDTKEKETNEEIGISEETMKEPDEDMVINGSKEETNN